LFDDFAPFRDGCRFLDCAHIKEPECSVLDAVKSGDIQKSRHDSYVRLYNQASEIKHWDMKNS